MPVTKAKLLPRATILLFLFASALLVGSFGCGPPSSQSNAGQGGSSSGIPELTLETINERINYARVRDVPEESEASPPIVWNFRPDEPKEITIVEKQTDGSRATIILDIKTRSSPRSQIARQLAGQIRTEWKLETGWVLRKWEIVGTENISMKYKDILKPPPENNSNAGRQ